MNKEQVKNIAIDGPAGAGKSTIARAVSKELGFIYVDTGALYRSIGVYALRQGVETTDGEKVAALQREMAAKNNVVMDGRDIGTVVLPQADVKIFLTASPEERARRRFNEMKDKGMQVEYEPLLEEIKQRDYNDSHREIAPLKQAPDAVLVDTTGDSLNEAVAKVTKLVREKLGL